MVDQTARGGALAGRQIRRLLLRRDAGRGERRPAYTGKASTDPEIGARVSYALAPRQMLFFDASASRLDDGIKDSPLVGRSNQLNVHVGYLYRY